MHLVTKSSLICLVLFDIVLFLLQLELILFVALLIIPSTMSFEKSLLLRVGSMFLNPGKKIVLLEDMSLAWH